jgi:hypothetical protein
MEAPHEGRQRIAVVMPVGPDAAEVQRCRDTALSIAAWEPGVRWLVLVDDAAAPRDLAAEIDAGEAEVVVLPHPLRGRNAGLQDRVAAAVIAAFGWVARETSADFVMKIDTDALVIAPFADKLSAGTAADDVGLLGSYDRTCNGDPRSFAPWVRPVKRTARFVQPRRIAVGARARRARHYVREARARGYVWGEHALACGLAMPRRTLDAIARGGAFNDPCTFVGTNLFDDPILGILVRRAGYRLAGHVDEGQTFGVAWRGLPDTPENLLARGYSIIHSVKNDQRLAEPEIRAVFQARRPPQGLRST